MKSADVRAALARKFCAPEYALFYEVGDATGGRQRRWADAIAMGLWPSRGLYLQGFEIKVSRSDWLVELRNPAKAEAISRFCHHWWIVTPPGIVRDDELPETWGLYEVTGKGLVCKRKAPVMPDIQPIDMPFLASLLRRADEHARATIRGAVDDAMRDERAAIETTVRERVDREVRARQGLDQRAQSALDSIKKGAGVDDIEEVQRWFDAEEFGRAVGLVHRLGIASTYRGLRTIAMQLTPMQAAIERMLPPAETYTTLEDLQ
ncbi:hypothetical protein [Sphingomonas sp. 3-13AW]|uniref:hypothetical protein n=1 Tax=Sphingomonas sp. 3-13AW TaxID=3050450 RepID=UPI003BB62294